MYVLAGLFGAFLWLAGPAMALTSQFKTASSRGVTAVLSISAPLTAGPVRTALKKAGPSVTVSVEFVPGAATNPSELGMLSMKLRRDCNVAAVWTPDLASVALIVKEQSTARGDYPGPCPVIFSGDATLAASAVAAGAAAVVLGPAQLADAAGIGLEIIWRVSSLDELAPMLATGHADAFLLAGPDALAIRAALPKDAVAILAVDAMQAANGEIGAGRAFIAEGGRQEYYSCRILLAPLLLLLPSSPPQSPPPLRQPTARLARGGRSLPRAAGKNEQALVSL